MNKIEIERIGAKIVDASYNVHKELGPGLLESVYECCLIEELKSRNLTVDSQVKLPVIYKGKQLGKSSLSMF